MIKTEEERIFAPVSEVEAKRLIGLGNIDSKNKYNKNRIRPLTAEERQHFFDAIRQTEAKLSDIPIPLNSEPLADFFQDMSEDKEIVLGYESFLSSKDAEQFYLQEMERLGWIRASSFNGRECLLNFKKPGKCCSVSIRTCSCDLQKLQKHVQIILFYRIT